MSAKDAKSLSLLVLEGDGIGPDITAATLGVLRAASVAAVISGPMPSPSSTRRLRLFASLALISASLPSHRRLTYLPF